MRVARNQAKTSLLCTAAACVVRGEVLDSSGSLTHSIKLTYTGEAPTTAGLEVSRQGLPIGGRPQIAGLARTLTV